MAPSRISILSCNACSKFTLSQLDWLIQKELESDQLAYLSLHISFYMKSGIWHLPPVSEVVAKTSSGPSLSLSL